MGFLQQFHLAIRYMKGIFNKFFDIISRPIISVSTLIKNDSIVHESYIEQYAHYLDFQDVYASLSEGNQVGEIIITCITVCCFIWANCVYHKERG